MRTTTPLLFSLSLLVPCIGCAAGDDVVDGSESKDIGSEALTGGELAKDGQFPSTVRIGCSAAVVGPRHILTAAHCVWDGAKNEPGNHLKKGDVVHYTNEVFVGDAAHWDQIVKDATIVETRVPEGVTWSCQDGKCGVLDPDVFPDVAVIEVEQDLGIPAATVDLRPVEPTDPLIIMGYGCEHGLNGPGEPIRLKYAEVDALPPSALDHETTWIPPGDARFDPLVAQYLFTPGQDMDPGKASICYGDSGGPVYRNDGTNSVIVGVNAYYSFTPEGSAAGLSHTNWHTRLDGESRFEIGKWLTDIGVKTAWTDGKCGELTADDSLTREERRTSCDGRFQLVMQSDGNLVLYQAGVGPLWASNTAGSKGTRAIMQSDGNFVLYDSDGKALWASGTAGNPGARFALQNDGNLVVYAPNNKALWGSATCCH